MLLREQVQQILVSHVHATVRYASHTTLLTGVLGGHSSIAPEYWLMLGIPMSRYVAKAQSLTVRAAVYIPGMQQLVDVGRNEPCPCGSGRKFKKCCLDDQVAAVAGGPTELDVVALVNDAIETCNWAAVYPHVDRALGLFARGGPLEHVRFRDDLVGSAYPDTTELARLCTTGWLNRCDLELARVLGRYKLPRDRRDGLRVAVHLLRRFGACSPVVEELARLQAEERAARMRRMVTALSNSGITTSDAALSGIAELCDWLYRVRPAILMFADWFALRAVTGEQLAAVWSSDVSPRICDFCLDVLDRPMVAERRAWTVLAAATLLGSVPMLGEVLAMNTPLRDPTAAESAIYTVFQDTQAGRPHVDMFQIIDDTESRGDFAGAALLREAMRVLQARTPRT